MTKTVPAKTKNQILELERRYWDALKSHDAEAAVELTDDPCVVVGPQGITEIATRDLKSMLEGDSFELQSYELNEQDVKFKSLGKNVAIVSYPVHERMKRDGQATTLDAYDSSVWVRQNGGWVCALHTETIAEPAMM